VATLAPSFPRVGWSRRRKIVGGVAAMAVLAAIAGGIFVYRAAHDDYGRSAAAVALAIGCSDFQTRTDTAGGARYHEQGICTLDGFKVKVTTFNDAAEQRAYGVLMNTLVPVYMHRSGAYAEGDGWNVADDVTLSRTLAVRVSASLGGTVKDFAAPAS